MNFAQVRAFHAVATQEGFTRAADQLGVSQPAVSGHVRALEEQVGQSLFVRRGHSIRLTAVGEALLERTRHLFARVDELDDFLMAAGRLEQGVLRIAADSPYGIMPLLRRFRRQSPNIDLRLHLGNVPRTLELLTRGESDVAIITAAEAPADMALRVLASDRIVCLVPAGHAWTREDTLPVARLHRQEMIVRERGSVTRTLFERAIKQQGIEPRLVMELGSREAVHEAVAAGIGVAVVFSREQPRDPRLRTILLEGDGLEGTQFLLCRLERRRLRLVDALFATAAEAGMD